MEVRNEQGSWTVGALVEGGWGGQAKLGSCGFRASQGRRLHPAEFPAPYPFSIFLRFMAPSIDAATPVSGT